MKRFIRGILDSISIASILCATRCRECDRLDKQGIEINIFMGCTETEKGTRTTCDS